MREGSVYTIEEDTYPLDHCESHPSRMWEWDGYTWICVGCILADPVEKKGSEKD